MGHVNNSRIIKLEIVFGISIISRHHFRVTRKGRVRDHQLWRFKRKIRKTEREVALMSFREALERNGKHADWVGE